MRGGGENVLSKISNRGESKREKKTVIVISRHKHLPPGGYNKRIKSLEGHF